MKIRTVSLLFLLLWLALATNAAESEATAKDEGTPKSEASPDNQQQQQQQQEQHQCSGSDDTCKVRIVTLEDLATKNGEDGGKELWLSILGRVYNVSKGPEYYAPGSGYHVFAGREGTVPFITGKFTDEECAKHTDELTGPQLYALDREWVKFYDKEERYTFLGFLCCRFYDEQGQPTEELQRVWERIKAYEKVKEAKDRERKENRRKMGMMAGSSDEAKTPEKAKNM